MERSGIAVRCSAMLCLLCFISVLPLFVRQWRTVQLFPEEAPLGHHLVHQISESIIVVSFKKVDHLVNQDVFQAGYRLLDQFQVQPKAPHLGQWRSLHGL